MSCQDYYPDNKVKVKKPLMNQSKEACMFCRKMMDIQTIEIDTAWFSYCCVDCMNEYAKKWNYELT